MSHDTPLRFLVGASRLISIYFVIRMLDTTASVVITYQMQVNAVPDLAAQMPSVWSIYLPTLIINLVLILITWFAAPFICRASLKTGNYPKETQSITVSMNETAIFLVGVLLLGWGLIRLGEDASRLFPARDTGMGLSLDAYTQVRLYSTILLSGVGFIMIARFPSIYSWLHQRKQQDQHLHDANQGEQADAGNRDKPSA